MPEFDLKHDHEHALRLAEKQVERAVEAIGEFLETRPYALVSNTDEERQLKTWRAKVQHSVTPSVRAYIGAAIATFRTSLDYLAFALVMKETGGRPKHVARIEFPIFLSEEKYEDDRGAVLKIGEASAEARARIRAMQPFHFGSQGEKHPLWVLHGLRREHMHRQLLAAGGIAAGAKLIAEPDAVVSVSFPGIEVAADTGSLVRIGAFNDGEIVAEATFANGRAIQAKLEATMTVAFAHDGPARGEPVVNVFDRVTTFIKTGVFPSMEDLL